MLEESDDALGDLETTKSTTVKSTTVKITAAPTTTTRSTTKSTTTASTTKSSTTQRSTKRYYYAPSKSPEDVVKTPKTYFSNSFYHNNNPNNINENSDTKKIVTQKTHVDTELPPPTPAPAKATINPFYYGFNRLPQNSTTQRSYRQLHFTTTNTPYSFQYFTPTKTVNLQASTPATNNDVDNNYYESQRPTNVEAEKPKSSTYNPVFDIYFKQIGRQRTSSTNRP